MSNKVLTGFSNILQDLSKLEINTVIKDNMSARKMTTIEVAIKEIALIYFDFFGKLDSSMKKLEDPNKFLEEVWTKLKENIFSEENHKKGLLNEPNFLKTEFLPSLNKISLILLENKQEDVDEKLLDPSNRVIFYRIHKNSEQLIKILNKYPKNQDEEDLDEGSNESKKLTKKDLENIDMDDRAQIRKFWDIGVEKVVMQTAVQLDGDVLTRIQEKYVDSNSPILPIHQMGVEVSLKCWTFLIESAIKLFKN